MKKFLVLSLIAFLIISNLPSASAEETPIKKCSITIQSDKNTNKNPVRGTGLCANQQDVLKGYYMYAPGDDLEHQFIVSFFGYHVIDKNGKTFEVSPPKRDYDIEVTVYTKLMPILTLNTVSDQQTKVTGKTNSKAKVQLYLNGKYNKTATADSKGNYSFSIKKQKAGAKVQVKTTNKEKNTSIKTTTVIDKTPPPRPKVNKVGTISNKVTGDAEKNSTAFVYKGKTKLGTAKVTSNGKYSVTIKKQKKGTKLTVYVKDKAGNKSANSTVTVIVIDKTPPAKPTVNTVSSKSNKVTGTAEKNLTAFVYKGKTRLGSVKVSTKGKFSVTIKKQKKGTKLTVYVKDKAGNKSASRTVTVK